jgi:hypothetical protein
VSSVSLYIINQITRDPEGDEPDGWFEERGAALAECDRLNAGRRRQGLGDNYQVAEARVESFAAALKQAEAARASALAATRVAFFAGARELFEAHPGLRSFGLQRYTFYSGTDEVTVFGFRVDKPDVSGVGGGEEGEFLADFAEFLRAFGEADLSALFGEDAVTVLRDGTVEVEEYVDDDNGCFSDACCCHDVEDE